MYVCTIDISLELVDPASRRFEHPHSNKMSMAHSAGGPWEIPENSVASGTEPYKAIWGAGFSLA